MNRLAIDPLTTPDELIGRPLPEIAKALAAGAVGSVALTKAYLARIAEYNPVHSAYVCVTSDVALAQARACDAALADGQTLGPLHGVPIALKDLCETEFAPTSNGMAIHRGRQTGRNAEVVNKLLDAGAVILGKLAMAEGACSSHHPDMPVPSNPWGPRFRVGSSSSGSGVAVAAGLAAAAIGSDTGGSIRFPSAYCGLTGLKPSYGLVSTHGVCPMAPSLDHIGPMADTAEGCALMLQAMLGLKTAPEQSALEGRRFGYLPHLLDEGLDAEVRASYRKLLDAAVAEGFELTPCVLPDTPDLYDTWSRLCAKELSSGHADTYPAQQADYGGALAALIEQGIAISGTQYAADRERLAEIKVRWSKLFEVVDWLALPIHAIVPPVLDNALGAPNDGIGNPLLFTAPGNVTGLPALALPTGRDSRGCPIGMQIMAPLNADFALLELGRRLQVEQLPPLSLFAQSAPPIAEQ